MNILIIDNHEHTINTFKDYLKKHGHAVWDSIDKLDIGISLGNKVLNIDIVILDYNLGMKYTGLDIIKKYKDKYPKIKWYANSAYTDHNELLINAGCELEIGKNHGRLRKVF